jgi:hypothetical protein
MTRLSLFGLVVMLGSANAASAAAPGNAAEQRNKNAGAKALRPGATAED